jgi:hypothetical protein
MTERRWTNPEFPGVIRKAARGYSLSIVILIHVLGR